MTVALSSVYSVGKHMKHHGRWNSQCAALIWILLFSLLRLFIVVHPIFVEGGCLSAVSIVDFCIRTSDQRRLEYLSEASFASSISITLGIFLRAAVHNRPVYAKRMVAIQFVGVSAIWILALLTFVLKYTILTQNWFLLVHITLAIVYLFFIIVSIETKWQITKSEGIIPVHWRILSQMSNRIHLLTNFVVLGLVWNLFLHLWMAVYSIDYFVSPVYNANEEEPQLNPLAYTCCVSVSFFIVCIVIIWYHSWESIGVRRSVPSTNQLSFSPSGFSPVMTFDISPDNMSPLLSNSETC